MLQSLLLEERAVGEDGEEQDGDDKGEGEGAWIHWKWMVLVAVEAMIG